MTSMDVRTELYKIMDVLMNNPNECVLQDSVHKAAALCETQYVAGSEMRKKLLRIQLGLAVESDS